MELYLKPIMWVGGEEGEMIKGLPFVGYKRWRCRVSFQFREAGPLSDAERLPQGFYSAGKTCVDDN